MKKLLILLLFIPLLSFGQKSNDADALKLCVALQSNNFTTDAEAEDAVNKILSVIGASQKPVLQACSNINNAVAAVYKGQRYILYDRDFMNSLTAGSNKYWSNMFILAHEVGHHINGHSIDIILYASDIIDPKSLEERRKQELEADEFAGFILAKLGATLSQTSKVLSNLPRISNENSSTHPSKDKRIASVRKGFSFKENFYLESKKYNYVVYYDKNKNSINNWDNVVTKPKKDKLDSISDPFERISIIKNEDVPDAKNISWVYGSIIENDNFDFKLPKLVLNQNKYGSREMKYSDYRLYLHDTYFVQKIYSQIPKKMIKFMNDFLMYYNFEFEYVFDDGSSGKFRTSTKLIHAFDDKERFPWELTLVIDDLENLNFQDALEKKNNSYYEFFENLKIQKKLFIKISRATQQFYLLGWNTTNVERVEIIKIGEIYDKSINEMNKFKLGKVHEFDLTGSSEALQFID